MLDELLGHMHRAGLLGPGDAAEEAAARLRARWAAEWGGRRVVSDLLLDHAIGCKRSAPGPQRGLPLIPL